jgi:hypothetical protein
MSNAEEIMSGAGNRTKRKKFLLDKERLGPNG